MPGTTARCAAQGLFRAGVLAGAVAGALTVGSLGALTATAAADPVPPSPGPAPGPVAAAAPAATPDGCQASKMTKTVGGVVNNAASYLEQHPDVDQAFTEIKDAPQDQIMAKTQSYLVSRPDVAASLGTIAAPLNDLRTKCGLPIDIPQMAGAGGMNPAMLSALSQNPAAQSVVQNPAAQALVQNPAVQSFVQNQPAQPAVAPQGTGPAPGPAQPAPAGPVGTGPAPGPRV